MRTYIRTYVYVCIHICIGVCIYIYIYIHRERERDYDTCAFHVSVTSIKMNLHAFTQKSYSC